MAACSPSPTSGPGTSANGPQPGVLRFAEIDEPDSLNTLVASQPVALDLSYFIYSFFFNVDDKMHLVPEVATRVPSVSNGGVSKDGKTIIYHLRRGVMWQDGVPLTARDVVFTYRAIMNDKNNVQGRLGYEDIGSVDAPNDYTVIVHMKKVDSPIVTLFMCLDGDYPILPAHLLARYPDLNHVPYNDKPVGSGPFKVESWARGDHLTLVANDAYWRGPPKLQRITVYFVRNNAEIVDRLRSGTIDAWFRSDPTLYPTLLQIPGMSVAFSPDNNFGHLDFNLRDRVVADVRVRRAIEMAVDRRKIVRDVTHYVYQTTDSDQPYSSWAYDRHVLHVGYNPKAARTLLARAGWRTGPDGVIAFNGRRLSLQMAYSDGSALDQGIADALKQELGAVGIEVLQRPYPTAALLASPQAGGIVYSGKYQIALFSWAVGVDPDDSWLYGCDETPPQGENSMFWCDPKVNTAEADALSTFDVARRKADYAIIQDELANQVPMIFMYAQRRADVYTSRFYGFKPSPTFAYWNAWQWQMQ